MTAYATLYSVSFHRASGCLLATGVVSPCSYPRHMVDESDDAVLSYLQDVHQEEDDTALREFLGVDDLLRVPQDLVRALLPPTRQATSADWREARRQAEHWAGYRFSAHEVRLWLAAGLEPVDADLADELLTEGIDPTRAKEMVQDPDSGEHLPITELCRRHYHSTKSDSLLEILDAAGVERQRLNRAPQWMRKYGVIAS